MKNTLGPEGWTVVHRTRQRHYDGRFYGQFLGVREGDIASEEAGDHLAEHATSLGKHLQRIGALSIAVFADGEVED
ncbi:hypothetical protein [Streptomyces sp. NBC_01304]|uniref:hypothetical protein n=1 Tax=Streptomyces sp. NBC_01304 TaxID=2903818 RepID=UPI002E117BF0|nr:hypothetical protein OG430_41035 [Streptomyces sp. NBC_01304]